jgi:transposase
LLADLVLRAGESGLAGQLVSASQAKNLKGRPKTGRLDAMWLARLTRLGLLRPSFVPPAAIRAVRDFTRARQDLVRDRTRVLQRLEKLLEDAMIKITSVTSSRDERQVGGGDGAGADRRRT